MRLRKAFASGDHRLFANAQRCQAREYAVFVFLSKSSLELASVGDVIALPASEINALKPAVRLGPSDDDERLAMTASRLGPIRCTTGGVRRPRALTDNAFQLEVAGPCPNFRDDLSVHSSHVPALYKSECRAGCGTGSDTRRTSPHPASHCRAAGGRQEPPGTVRQNRESATASHR
jgi:hypothetical protein